MGLDHPRETREQRGGRLDTADAVHKILHVVDREIYTVGGGAVRQPRRHAVVAGVREVGRDDVLKRPERHRAVHVPVKLQQHAWLTS